MTDVAVANVFDMRGNNVIAIHWEVDATNRDGVSVRNNGVSLVTSRKGKVVRAKEFIFDTGDEFRTIWGEAGGRAVADG